MTNPEEDRAAKRLYGEPLEGARVVTDDDVHLLALAVRSRLEGDHLHGPMERALRGALRTMPLADSGQERSQYREQRDRAVEILESLAIHAWDHERIDDLENWQEEPPLRAIDHFNDDHVGQCGRCGSWNEVVRPGKSQCPTCGDDDLTGLAIRARAFLSSLEQKGEG